jgi:hypothetical protein
MAIDTRNKAPLVGHQDTDAMGSKSKRCQLTSHTSTLLCVLAVSSSALCKLSINGGAANAPNPSQSPFTRCHLPDANDYRGRGGRAVGTDRGQLYEGYGQIGGGIGPPHGI